MSSGERRHLVLPHPVVEAATVQEHERAARVVVRPDGQVAVWNGNVGPCEIADHDTQGVIPSQECQPRCHNPSVPHTSPDELAQVFDLLGPLYRQTVRNLEQASTLPVGVRAVLDLLRVRESLTVPRIADVLGLSRQFVQRCVNEAEEAGWVELRTNPAHQRSSLVVITESGRELVTGIRAGESESLAPVAATISRDDVAACVRVLTQLLDLVRLGPG